MRWEELPLMLAGRPEGVVWIRWQPCFRRSFHSYSTLQEEAQQCGQPHKLPHRGVVISVISMHNWLLGYSAGASPTLVQNSVAGTMKLISLLCIILSKAAFDGIHEKQIDIYKHSKWQIQAQNHLHYFGHNNACCKGGKSLDTIWLQFNNGILASHSLVEQTSFSSPNKTLVY